MFSQLSFAVLILCGVLLSACASIYNPNKIHAPFLSTKNEVQIEGSYGAGQGVNLGVAYALTNSFAVTGNFGLFRETSGDSNYQRQTLVEAGAGMYTVIQKNIFLEYFLIGSYGNINVGIPGSIGTGDNYRVITANASFFKMALQGDILFNKSNPLATIFDEGGKTSYGLGGRFEYVNFFQFQKSQWLDSGTLFDQEAYRELFFTAAAIIRYGAYPMFVEGQVGLNNRLYSSRPDEYFYNRGIYCIGLNVNF